MLMLAGCGGRPAALNCRATTDPAAVIARCLGGDLQHGNYIGDLACYPFAAPEQLRGVWVASLENSSFYRDAAAVPAADIASDTWLEASPLPHVVDIAMQGGPVRVYAVKLIGRRSLCPAHFGHMGVFRNEVVVSRFVSMRPIP